MALIKDFAKFLAKILDDHSLSTIYPNIINRNYRAKFFLRNDYEVDEKCEYIFMHLPKTGGMTFQNLLKEINKKHNNIFFVGAHNPVSLFHNTNQKKYITIFRDPIERAYSFYNMNLNDKKQVYYYLAKKGLYNFVRYCPEIQNTYCQYFSGFIDKNVDDTIFNLALKNYKNFFEIIDFNNMNEELKFFFKKINIQVDQIPHINKFSYSDKNKDIPIKDRAILEFFNGYDLKLYNIFKSER